MSPLGRRSVAVGAALLTFVCFLAILLGKPNLGLSQKSDTTPQLGPARNAESEFQTASMQATTTTRKSVVYFHFAPAGCENCAGLAPTMQRFYEEHGSEYDVRGIVITHWGRHDATAVRNFVRSYGITFPIIGFKSLASTETTNLGHASGFLPQGTQKERSRASSPPSAVINANTRRHPVVQVYNPETRVTRVASVGNVTYTSMVEQIEVISRGGSGPVLQGST